MRLSRKQVSSSTHAIPEIRFEEQRLTSFGGLVVFASLIKFVKLRHKLYECVRHLPSGGGFAPSKVLLLLIVHLLLGWRRLRDLDYYRTDPLVEQIVGLKRMPTSSTFARRLSEFDDKSVDRLRAMLRGIVGKRAATSSQSRLTFDFDGSVVSTKARGIEGTAVGYNSGKKGSRSYYPLFAVVAQTGQVFDLLHRPGNSHDSQGALEFMLKCQQNIKKEGFRGVLEVRIDSAHYSDSTCTGLHEAGVEYSVSVPFERLVGLREKVLSRQRWNRIDSDWSYFELEHSPSLKSEWSYPCVVYRRRIAKPRKGPIQLDLFIPIDRDYEYKVVMTNKSVSAKSLLAFHNGRGSQEATFAEVKSQLGLGYLPCRKQVGNQIYMVCNLVAHALGRELQMVASKPLGMNTPNRACLWPLERLGTLRNRIIKRAARLIHPQGRTVVSFATCPDAERDIRQLMEATAAAA